jgi:hypothetical protein
MALIVNRKKIIVFFIAECILLDYTDGKRFCLFVGKLIAGAGHDELRDAFGDFACVFNGYI